jgi:hypothetical protein
LKNRADGNLYNIVAAKEVYQNGKLSWLELEKSATKKIM